MLHLFRLVLVVLALGVSTHLYAKEIRVGRYSTLNPVATAQERDPLSVVIEISFPAELVTVHHALLHVLRRSGYNLATGAVADPRLPDLLNASLPEVHRQLGPITLRNALQTLAGDAWVLVEDPVLRLVSFELKAIYRGDEVHE